MTISSIYNEVTLSLFSYLYISIVRGKVIMIKKSLFELKKTDLNRWGKKYWYNYKPICLPGVELLPS